MRQTYKCGLVTAAVLILCAAALTGCKKYTPLDLPAIEEERAEITQEAAPESEPPESQSVAAETMAPGTTGETEMSTEAPPEFQETEETVYVTEKKVNLRKGYTLESEVITQLDRGTALTRTGYSEEWSRVVYKDQVCYIATKYLSKTEPETEPARSGKMIAIDPGHQARGNAEKEPVGPGSSTMKAKVASGTQGAATGLPEYQLTLAVSLKLKEELESRGYQVYMIRETNEVNLSNAERAEKANNSGADIFIRVHANSLDDSSVHGTLTMCQTAENPYNGSLYGKSLSLSKAVAGGVSAATGFKNRGVQETDSMSGINWCKIPVTIVEMGFMSNAEEDKKMATEEYQKKIAEGIADGVDAYYAAGN